MSAKEEEKENEEEVCVEGGEPCGTRPAVKLLRFKASLLRLNMDRS